MNGKVLLNLSSTAHCLNKEFIKCYEKQDIPRLNEITYEQNIIKDRIAKQVNPQTLYIKK